MFFSHWSWMRCERRLLCNILLCDLPFIACVYSASCFIQCPRGIGAFTRWMEDLRFLLPIFSRRHKKILNNKVLVLETIMRRAIEWEDFVWCLASYLSKITAFQQKRKGSFKPLLFCWSAFAMLFLNWLSFYASTCIVISRAVYNSEQDERDLLFE